MIIKEGGEVLDRDTSKLNVDNINLEMETPDDNPDFMPEETVRQSYRGS